MNECLKIFVALKLTSICTNEYICKEIFQCLNILKYLSHTATNLYCLDYESVSRLEKKTHLLSCLVLLENFHLSFFLFKMRNKEQYNW